MEGIDKAIEMGYNPVKVFYRERFTIFLFFFLNLSFILSLLETTCYPKDNNAASLWRSYRPQSPLRKV